MGGGRSDPRRLWKSETRREFLKQTSFLSGALMGLPFREQAARIGQKNDSDDPWYRRTYRWGQTNINELDPSRYDIDWWRQHWKRTRTQGLVINAGGIVAYYPSRNRLQYRARYLGERDLYGELVRAAHQDGLVVLARMDSNRAHEEFYRSHPEWFAVDLQGNPYRAGDRYVSCIDGPYYEDYLPGVLKEIIEWEKPEGFTDNSWSGLDRDHICYCRYSREKFRQATGLELPAGKDWEDSVYRRWVQWSYSQRLEVWERNNRTTRTAGGPECLWLGMIGGDLISQGQRFRDVRAILKRSEMVMLDDQGRSVGVGFQENAEMGKRLHEVLGWEKVIAESMAMYQRSPTFRKAAASKAEARMWMFSGFAGTIQPWWHHVGAFQWDRRQFTTAGPVYRWYADNQRYLVNRSPLATIGVVYSLQNADFYGREEAEERVARPYYGVIQALVRARLPYLPVHVDDVERLGSRFSLLILPNLAALSEGQARAVRRFAAKGGALLATGETSLYDPWGDRHSDFALADLFGIHDTGRRRGSTGAAETWEGTDHSYLRLHPSIGREVYGPWAGEEPQASDRRHPVLAGFEETDILPFGGLLVEVEKAEKTLVPITFVPSFPAYPPETSWMREPRTDIPALVLKDSASEVAGRRAYLAADIDRRFARDNLPDHGDLLANLIRWTVRDDIPLRVKGKGLIDCHLYQQPGRLILHLVNLTSAESWRSPVHELIPVGPFEISARLPEDVTGGQVRTLVSGHRRAAKASEGWARFEVERLVDHEVAVIE